MDSATPDLGVIGEAAAAAQRVDGIAAEAPKPLKKLSPAERRVWNYVAGALKDYGLIHRTDAMLMHLIVSTFVKWIDAEAALERHIEASEGSFMVKMPNSTYEQPHQSYYVARGLKAELLRMLPEACLTIPSFAKVQQMLRPANQQPGLFDDDPLTAFVAGKPQPPKLVHSA